MDSESRADASTNSAHELLAVMRRRGVVESQHFGTIVALGSDGALDFALGNPELAVVGRSTLKPLQGAAIIESGTLLTPSQLAVVCSSHSAWPQHLREVRSVLFDAGLSEGDLANVEDYPFDVDCMRSVVRAGHGKMPIFANCSGKHAGMLVCSRTRGWPVDRSYLDQEHPVQRAIFRKLEDMIPGTVITVGADGCGAPTYACSIIDLARAYRRLALSDRKSPEGRVFAAATTHPELAAGRGRIATDFMTAIPNLYVKDGAEGLFFAVMRDGRTVGVKIADGNPRACRPALRAGLRLLGVNVSSLGAAGEVPVYGGREVVGAVEMAGPLAGF